MYDCMIILKAHILKAHISAFNIGTAYIKGTLTKANISYSCISI